MNSKVVRFYELRGVREEGNGATTVPVSPGFWTQMADHVESLPVLNGRFTSVAV